MCPQRFQKVPFLSVHTYTRKQRFQKVPFWRAFSKSSVYGSRIRKEKVAFSNENGYVWTRPEVTVLAGLNKQKDSPETSTRLSVIPWGATRILALRVGRIRGYSNSENCICTVILIYIPLFTM